MESAAAPISATSDSPSTITDVPRDGAGSPLFTATAFAPSGPTVGVATSSTRVTSTLDTAPLTTTSTTIAPAATTAVALPDSAAAELAALGAATATAGETFETAMATGLSAATQASTTAEPSLDTLTTAISDGADLPIVSASETGATAVADELRSQASTETSVSAGPVQRESGNVQTAIPANTTVVAQDSKPASNGATGAANRSAEQAPNSNVAPSESTAPVAEQTAPEQLVVPTDEPVATAETAEAPTPARPSQTESSTRPARQERATAPVGKPAPRASAPVIAAASDDAEIQIVPVPSQTATTERDVLRQKPVVTAGKADQEATGQQAADELVAQIGMISGGTTAANSTSAATATVNAATHEPVPVATPTHISQQIQQALASYEAEVQSGTTRSFELVLDPPELGRLMVQMSRNSKGMDVRISAENETVRGILEAHGADLQQSLQLAGFDLGQFSGSAGGDHAGGLQEWIAAPTLKSFATGTQPVTSPSRPANRTAVDVVV